MIAGRLGHFAAALTRISRRLFQEDTGWPAVACLRFAARWFSRPLLQESVAQPAHRQTSFTAERREGPRVAADSAEGIKIATPGSGMQGDDEIMMSLNREA